MKNSFSNFKNLYPLSKTLRFSLLPIAETLDNIYKNEILSKDEQRAKSYKKVKKLIDEYHKVFIESQLSNFWFSEKLNQYFDLYLIKTKDDKQKKEMQALEEALRKEIVKAFTSSDKFNNLFNKSIIEEYLWENATEEDKKHLELFAKFTTYFSNFNINRKNMYSSEEKSTAISYRVVNQNLPKFIDNIIAFKKIKNADFSEQIKQIESDFSGLGDYTLDNIFDIDYYSRATSQSGIEAYNNIIGGYSNSDGSKVQGLNEKINHYNQEHKDLPKLPLLKPLYKQILSDRSSISFIPESFKSDNEVIKSIYDFFNENYENSNENFIKNTISNLTNLFDEFDSYKTDSVFIKNGVAITDLSNGVFDNWSEITDALNNEYDSIHKKNKDYDKHVENRKKYFKKIDSFSIKYLQELTNCENKIVDYYKVQIKEKSNLIINNYQKAKSIIESEYPDNKNLINDDETIEIIKTLLDSVVELKNFIKPLLGSGKESTKDIVFYGNFEELYDKFDLVTLLYNKVRNYVSQKPYSTEKIKLNFNNSQLMNGWDANKLTDYLSAILKKDGKYYLAIMDKTQNKILSDISTAQDDDSNYLMMNYKLLPGANKMLPKVFFSKKQIEYFNPSNEIKEIYFKKASHKKGDSFNIDDCHKLIDFFKQSIEKHPDWKEYEFNFSETKSYKDISEFYREVEQQGYKINFNKISESYIKNLVAEGKLYLFQIYNKDFSEKSKGTKNLHTLYFEMLFDEKNLSNVVYKLNGQCEMFYRKASIKKDDIIVHRQNEPIKNKNSNKTKETSTFGYDIIKDRRFTVDSFQLHIPITMNFKAKGQSTINNDVRRVLKESNDTHVIGIDRGERNLIYLTVVSPNGDIIEQYSLNEIITEYNGNTYKTDYHQLLDYKEDKRKKERQQWKTIENIKELKKGYLSQVVHKIVTLMLKYNAVVVLEDLNSGMKNSRIKVEKQVYQNFENMLIDKLKYCVNKKLNTNEDGGLLNAYQLVNFESKSNQNGFIFYIPAWNTSKIDPVTGFVNLFDLRKKSIEQSKKFINTFDKISYNPDRDYFEFKFDYHKFGGRANNDYRRYWTVCTYKERIEIFRDKNNNNKTNSRSVNLTEEFKSLFDEFSIEWKHDNLIEQVCKQTKGDFFNKFMRLFKLTLQLRNSKSNSTLPEDDYLISPVADKNGKFYDSRDYIGVKNAKLPCDSDANGAYNIARKGLWVIDQFKNAENEEQLEKARLSIKNSEWLEFTQRQDV